MNAYIGFHGKQFPIMKKGLAIDKPFNSYPFIFFRLEIEKPPPYVGDIWVPT